MANKEIKGVIVGAGYIGKVHAEAYAGIPGVKIAAVVDSDVARACALGKPLSARAYADFLDAERAERPDFVDICLPSGLHRACAEAALAAGLDVIVEKPFALDLEDADAMMAASRRSGRRLMVAHVCRFMPQYEIAHRAIAEGSLGKPLFYAAWRESETPAWSWKSWILDPSKSGGTVMDLSIHDIDIANWLLGEPVGHRAMETRSPGGGASHVTSLIRYASGSHASIEAGQIMPKGYPFGAGYRLVFEGGVLEWDSSRGSVRRCAGGAVAEISVSSAADPSSLASGDDPYRTELAHFVSCLASGEDFRISPEEARLAVSTVLALRLSMDDGGNTSYAASVAAAKTFSK